MKIRTLEKIISIILVAGIVSGCSKKNYNGTIQGINYVQPFKLDMLLGQIEINKDSPHLKNFGPYRKESDGYFVIKIKTTNKDTINVYVADSTYKINPQRYKLENFLYIDKNKEKTTPPVKTTQITPEEFFNLGNL